MSLTIVNAEWAEAGEGVETLRETIASLEAQLSALYQEKEAAGAAASSTGGGDDRAGAEVMALYEEKLRAGARAAGVMRETLTSFEAQLHALYAEREEQTSELDALRAAADNLAAQLGEFYALQERHGGRPLAEVAESARSFEAQLAALYAEREAHGAGAAPGPDGAAMAETLASFEQQLAVLYEERSQPSPERAMVESLEAQVAALLEEKEELAHALARAQSRAQALIAAVVERSLALA